jgi:outer membrane protein assembly factor BamB
MAMRRSVCLVLLITLVFAGCAIVGPSTPRSSTSVVYGLDGNGDLAAYNVSTGQIIWSRRLSGNPRDLVADAQQWHLLVVGNTVYFLYQDLTAYRATDGKQLWQVPISQGIQHPGQLVWGGDALYALVTPLSTSVIYALNPQSGALIWKQELTNLQVPTGDIPPDEANAATYHAGILYLATDYGAAALNTSDRQLIWDVLLPCDCSFNYSSVIWTQQALLLQNGDASGVSGNTSIPNVSYVIAVNPSNGAVLWNNFDSAQSYDYSAITSTIGLYAITDTAIESLNTANGKTEWSVPISHIDGGANGITEWFIGPSVLVVVTGPSGGDLVALNTQSGTLLWQYQSTDSFATLAMGDATLYVLGSTGVKAFSSVVGTPLWSQHQPGADQALQITIGQNRVLVTNPQVSIGGPPACAVLDPSNGKQLWTSNTNGCAFLYAS